MADKSDEGKDVKEMEGTGGSKDQKEGAQKEKKGDKKEGMKDKSSNSYLIPAVFVVAILVVAAIAWVVMSNGPSQKSGPSDAEIIAQAVSQSSSAMSAAQQANNFTVSRSEGDITTNDDSYQISFPIADSDKYGTFDVVLDMNLTLEYVGLDGNLLSPSDFMGTQSGPNLLQTCAKAFNEQEIIPNLISQWYNTTKRMRYIMTIPKVLDCGGTEYPYTLEIGNGYVTTTIAGNYYKNGFTKDIVRKGVTIPAGDVQQGVFVYVDVVGPYQLGYSYELRDKSVVTFDAYGGAEAAAYNIKVVPSLVWNCKYVNAGTKATGELNGTFAPGSEETMLKTLGCIFNNGIPADVCSEVGVVRNAEGKIDASLPTEALLTMYDTTLESCKLDNEIVKVQAFYAPDCPDCENQRRVLDKVAQDFGSHMDLTYYCAGNKTECDKLVEARA